MTSVTTLGGSAAGVGTGHGCSGYLVQEGKTRIVLDLGPNTLLELRKHTEIRTLDAIFVSHLHMDHLLDLFALRFTLAYSPIPLPAPIPLWLPPGGLAFFAKAADLFQWEGDASTFFTTVYEMAEYDPASTVTVAGLTVSFKRTEHSVPCWAMRVSASDGTSGDLVYSADTFDTSALESFAQGAKVVVCESTEPETPAPGTPRLHPHSSAEEAARLAVNSGASTLVLTHIWEEDIPQRSVEMAHARFGGEVLLARPGVTVQW